MDGADRSGEKKTEGYPEFFLALQDLNHFKLDERSRESDVAAAYMISLEVSMDIRTYAEKFICQGGIEAGALRKELEIIGSKTTKGSEGRILFLQKYKSRREISALQELVDDAVERIDMIEKRGGLDND